MVAVSPTEPSPVASTGSASATQARAPAADLSPMSGGERSQARSALDFNRAEQRYAQAGAQPGTPAEVDHRQQMIGQIQGMLDRQGIGHTVRDIQWDDQTRSYVGRLKPEYGLSQQHREFERFYNSTIGNPAWHPETGGSATTFQFERQGS